jgi:hypothetical protein
VRPAKLASLAVAEQAAEHLADQQRCRLQAEADDLGEWIIRSARPGPVAAPLPPDRAFRQPKRRRGWRAKPATGIVGCLGIARNDQHRSTRKRWVKPGHGG